MASSDINPVTPLFNGVPISDDNPMPVSATVEPAEGGATEDKQDAQIALIGEVQTTPTANTVLGRLKTIGDGLSTIALGIAALVSGTVLAAGSAIIGKVGFDRTTPGTTNSVAPISGQDGVAGGSGAVSALTQRVVLATDDAAVTSLAIVDDWDESDRAKVNIIAGQVGVAAGAGAVSAGTQRMTLASDDPLLARINGGYETVAASQTDQALGATGATGDYLAGLLIVPATTSPGAVSIKDGAGSSITVFTGGASSVTSLVPFTVPLGMLSGSGAWKVTTGANVSVIGVGKFT